VEETAPDRRWYTSTDNSIEGGGVGEADRTGAGGGDGGLAGDPHHALAGDPEAYAEIVESAPLGLYVAQDGMLVYGNRWLREFCGAPMSSLPRSPMSVVVPEDRPLVMEQFLRRMRGEPSLPHYTVRILRADGSATQCELYAQVVTWRGRPAVYGSVIDTSDKADAERRLRDYTAHLEEANRYRQLFGEIISQDLLNPIWSVQSHLRMARDEPDPERRRALLEQADATLERTREILQDARAYLGRQGPRNLPFEPLDLGGLIEAAVERLRRQWERGGQRVRVTLPGPIAVVGNVSLREVFVNLLANAIEHGPPGSGIEVVASGDGPARVEFRDQGPRVPAGDRERVFRRFERLAPGRGSGLELAVVKSIVALHRGRVWVEDDPGGGSVFVLELPVAPAGGPPPAAG
jgi:PAS domain S-box-containing protein